MPPLTVGVYDLDVSPLSFDFLHFLCACHTFSGGGHIHAVICPGGREGWRTKLEVKPIDDAERRWRLDHMLVPLARMMGCSVTVAPDRGMAGAMSGGAENPSLLPVRWSPETPNRLYDFSILLKTIRMGYKPPFRASEKARRFVGQMLDGRPVVTITLRETHTPTRNSNLTTWLKVAYQLERRGYQAVIVPDTEKLMGNLPSEYRGTVTHCPMAALDLDIRMALYERATLNLSRSGGPFMLAVLAGTPYLFFGILAEPYFPPGTYRPHFVPTAEFMAMHGLPKGDNIHRDDPCRRVVWEDDSDPDLVLNEVLSALETAQPIKLDPPHGYPLMSNVGEEMRRVVFQDGATRPPPSASATSPRP